MKKVTLVAMQIFKVILTRKEARKYIIIGVLFLLIVFFFDGNSVYKRREHIKKLEELKADKNYYVNKIKSDSTQLYEFKNNLDKLEKFAREKYYMKKKGEEIFVIIEK